ncbi:DUF4262 domain-containing protein [Kitasatospora sp. NPDC001664]
MVDDPFQCRCVLCHDYGDRDEVGQVERAIIGNVQEHGWHVVMVPEDEIGPGFAYTIGLAHTYGTPELAMFGLDVHLMHRMLNTLGERAVLGTALADGQEHHSIARGLPVRLRRADPRWYRTFLGQAIRFYRRPPLPVLQVAWPDASGRFHWEEGVEPGHRDSQPQLWRSPDGHPAGVWTAEF